MLAPQFSPVNHILWLNRNVLMYWRSCW